MNAAPPEPSRGRPRWVGLGKWALGVVLLSAAGVFVWLRRGDLAQAGEQLAEPSASLIAAFLLCVAANLFCTSWLYWLLTRPYAAARPLPLRSMCALIMAASLLNYLPLRAGLLGRVAYQKRVFGVTLADSSKTVLQAIGLSGVCAMLLVAAALMPRAAVPYALAAPVFVGLAVGAGTKQALLRRLAHALALRQVDALLWVARYGIVFALLGRDISLSGASAVAGVGMLATFVPFTSNGLGLREWAVGLTAAILPAGWLATGDAAGGATGIALAADLLNRAGELVIIVPAGLLGIWLLRRGRAVDARRGRGAS